MTANTQQKKATKKTVAKKPTSPSEWKKQKSEPIELPSGNYMVLRAMSMSTLMRIGKLPNSLMDIMQQAVSSGTGMAGVDESELMREMMGDENKVKEYMAFMDDLVTMVALDPAVSLPPENYDDRDLDTLYTDDIDDEDKSFIFQVVVGGTTDLEQFRKESQASMAALSGRQDVELPAE